MEKVIPVEQYIFHNNEREGRVLYLTKGVVANAPLDSHPNDKYRWMINGLYNPIPVKNGTWFVGLAPDEMIGAIKKCGWHCDAYTSLYGIVKKAIIDAIK